MNILLPTDSLKESCKTYLINRHPDSRRLNPDSRLVTARFWLPNHFDNLSGWLPETIYKMNDYHPIKSCVQ